MTRIATEASALSGMKSKDTIQFLESRFAYTVLVVGIVVAFANYFGRLRIYSDGALQALVYPSVWVTALSGVVVFVAARLRNRFGRYLQAMVPLGFASGMALTAVTGDLTSLVFFGLAILLAAQYGLLQNRAGLKLGTAIVIYGAFFAIGTYLQSRSTSLGAVLNLVGAGFIAYLFVVIASLRLREMENRQAELARMVAERTKELQDEADRRKVAEEEARATAERNETLAGDREVLLRELHHRSKNDLQMILSLLSLRADRGDHPELVDLFRPTQDRIRAIALVHEQLDGSERFDAIELTDYLQHLLSYLQTSHREYTVRIEADIDTDVSVKLESATHLGLLVHELVLCSYRFSFQPGSPGTIYFAANVRDGTLNINIRDSGEGLPEELDPESPDKDEIAIVSGLVRRLECELTLDRHSGGEWKAVVPLSAVQKQPVVPAFGGVS